MVCRLENVIVIQNFSHNADTHTSTKGVTAVKAFLPVIRFPNLCGSFTSQCALVGWGFVKTFNDIKSNPHHGPG